MATTTTSAALNGVAIIGMSGRFPGADNLDAFWSNLCDGVESITSFTDDELRASGVDEATLANPHYVKSGMILNDVETFDASFFGYTPREAELMDPQHRILLECAWEALEHAGYDSERYKGWIGVFSGATLDGYLLYNLLPNPELRDLMRAAGKVQIGTANETDYLTTRVSYKLHLKGPSVNLQTACSTSLVATHLACQSLLSYQCDIALASGVSARVPQKEGYWYQEGGVGSPDGHCRTFDAQARGTVFSSGVGVVVLKRLADALADGDTIHALIRGTAVNNDGAMKIGFTAPSVEGQAEVIAMAQHVAGIDPESISYIEAHGTATSIGDPIEVTALTQAFRAGTQKKQFCAIGSVKTNIGHTGTAAGVAGLIKTTLALKHRLIPPSLHFETPNPKIDFANSPFYVNTKLAEWPANGGPRRAGVSSFGIGGTNAHAIVEEAPPARESGPARPWQLLALAAKTSSALEAATSNLAAHLRQHPEDRLADVAYTLQVGRRAFNHRRVLVCKDREDALALLETRDPKRVLTSFREQRERPVVFMFSGQGAQYVDMALELYQSEPTFREHVDRCCDLLLPHLGLDLRDVLYPDDGPPTTDHRPPTTDQRPISDSARPFTPSPLHPFTPSPLPRLDETWLTQPALFAIEYALARLWMEWGLRPEAMIGHSIGEYVAACLAGVFSLEDALALVAARGRLMQQLPAGAMTAVPLPEHETRALLDDQLALAAINGPSRCVVAGPVEAVAALEQRLAAGGVDCRRLHTSHAFHSAMMESIVAPFTDLVRQMALKAPAIPYISNLTGTWITAEAARDPAYWARHLRETVRFADGVRELTRRADRVLLEVGPGQMLTTLVRQHPDRSAGQLVLPSLRHPQEQQPDVAFLLGTLGQLWLAGVELDWNGVHTRERRRRLPLPAYPFERRRYWIDPPRDADLRKPPAGALQKKPDIADWFYIPVWKQSNLPDWTPGDLAKQPRRWLVFEDAPGIGAQLAARLKDAGQEVVSVRAGAQFDRLDERAYTIDPRRPEDYDALLDALSERKRAPHTIVHLWSVTGADIERAGAAFREESQALGFYSLLFLAQALGRQNSAEPLHLGVVSNNMRKIAGETALYPEKATLLGPCGVIPAEYPHVTCQSIDITLPEAGTPEAQELIHQLVAELAAPAPERAIAYRGRDRWVQSYDVVRLEEALEDRNRLRPDGVYLITGGLGGIGLVLAEYLARTVRARLVLTGRSAFPAREAWDGWLAAHSADDRVGRQIRKVRELEQLGAQVLIISADVADEQAMRAAIDQTLERFGALHGVIHSAGIAGGGLIQIKTRGAADRVLAPKVHAMWALEAALGDRALDFLVLCSSTTAIIGGIGQVDYCAANAFLDAYAHYNAARRGTWTVSINWEAWEEVGMAVDAASAYGRRAAPQAAYVRPTGHPLLDLCIEETPGRSVYRTELSVSTHWLLREHKITGIGTIPGTTYLELARAAFEDRFKEPVAEIEEVFFLSPLMVGEDEIKEAHTILEGTGDLLDFRVISRLKPLNGEQPHWQEHVRGKIRRLGSDLPRRYDIAALIARCNRRELVVTDEDYRQAERLVYWGPRWRSLTNVYIGDDEGLGRIELADAFAADIPQFGLHPALLDVATAFANRLVGEGEAYLPLSYDRLEVKGVLPQRLYSYIRTRDGAQSRKETITFQVTLMDEHGQELVEIEGFTIRKVGETGMKLIESVGKDQHDAIDGAAGMEPMPRDRLLDTAPAMIAAGQQAPSVIGIAPREGVEAFRRILSRNRLPQIAVSSKDLHAVIERAGTITQSRVVEELDKAQEIRAGHVRPNIQTPYVAPRNDAERRLAEIWQQVLGIEAVGIHDNFFELGGDSVLAVQIIAKTTAAGIRLTPAQLFENQVIAELAALVSPAQAPQVEQEPQPGPLPLTPIQRWFFEQRMAEPNRWSQARLFETRQPLDAGRLARAAQHLARHHDALRLRFIETGSGWQQIYASADADAPTVQTVDLQGMAPADCEAALAGAIAAAQAGLDLAAGPLLRITWLEREPSAPGYLLLVAHGLIVDEPSWSVLIEDLLTAYEQLNGGAPVELPERTATFQQWANQVQRYAQSADLRAEAAYWRAVTQPPLVTLPRDNLGGDRAGGTRSLSVALDPPETDALLHDVSLAYQTRLHEILLTALAQTLGAEPDGGVLLLDLEGDGRAGKPADLDLARTVGQCGTRYPARLDLCGADGPGAAIKTIKEQLRAVPRQGIGYGALRYLSQDAAADDPRGGREAEVLFTCREPAEHSLPAAVRLSAARHTLPGPGQHVLEVHGFVAEKQLRLEWTYDEAALAQATVEGLAATCLGALRDLIEHCLSPDAGGYTPSDFPDINLSQAELDTFLTRIGG